MGWLERMTQFKEKAGKGRENASVGLFNYPVLMAADILIYRATHVPVGDDQKQHLELARDVAQKFNNDFSESIAANGHGDAFFPLPEPLIQGPATRVMSLRDGSKKMSKSDTSENAYIALTDDPDTIAQKIRKAKTDPEPLPGHLDGLAGRPEAENLVGIFAALTDRSKADIVHEFGGSPFSAFKTALADVDDRKARPDPGRDPAACGRSRLRGHGARRWRGKGPRHRAAEHGRGQGHSRARSLKGARPTENLFADRSRRGPSSPFREGLIDIAMSLARITLDIEIRRLFAGRPPRIMVNDFRANIS